MAVNLGAEFVDLGHEVGIFYWDEKGHENYEIDSRIRLYKSPNRLIPLRILGLRTLLSEVPVDVVIVFADMSKAMGENWGNIFKNFNTCYDKHGDYVLVLDEGLTYMPEGVTQTQEGEDYRKFYFLYYKPENQGTLREAMKGVKELFASKDSKEY